MGGRPGQPIPNPSKVFRMPDDRTTPQPAYIEIIERGRVADDGIIVPNEIRINGTPLLAPYGQSVKVHEINVNGTDAACVTLTLYARRVVIGAEGDA